MRAITFIFFPFFYLFCIDFCVSTYNVENLFDGVKNGNEYKEFIPSKYGWSEEEAQEKFKKTLQVLKNINSKIFALQEVENEELIIRLKNSLGYKYHVFAINKHAPVGLGFISKYPITKQEIYTLKNYEKFRPILYLRVKINNEEIGFYVNHLPSLKHEDSFRLAFIKSLKQHIKENNDLKYIAIGDFNISHEESSIVDTVFGNSLYDPWFEVSVKKRWSYVYKDSYDALDRIFLSNSLLEKEGIFYKKESFQPLFLEYALNSKGHPKGNFRGHSDHLPLVACFSDEAQKYLEFTKHENKILPIFNVIVLYEDSRGSIIYDGKKNIFIKNQQIDFEVGKSYEIKALKGQNRTTSYKIVKEINGTGEISPHIKRLTSTNNLQENDVLVDIKGLFYNGKIVGDFGKINFYRISKKPKNKEMLNIKAARVQMRGKKIEIIAQ